MRFLPRLLLIACFPAAILAAPGAQQTDATGILAATREALGGEQRLSAVRTFVATGRTRQVRGNNLVPIEFEIACELPDKYVRRDEIPAQESGPTSSGFNGDTLIQLPPPPEPPAQLSKPATPPASGAAPAPTPPVKVGGSPGAPTGAGGKPAGPPSDPRRARVNSLKQDFARLTLGMFATSFSAYPLEFTMDGQAEAPQGKADIIDVKGPENFAMRLFVAHETHLPIMVSWTTPATNVVMKVPGQPAPENVAPGSVVVEAPPLPASTATKEEQAKYAKDVQDLRKKALSGAKPVEYRVYYGDYRDIGNGVRFPFRLRRAIAGETVEETNFDSFRTNVRIDPRRFGVAR